MALIKEQSAQLAALGFDVDKLTAAIKAPGDVAIDLPAGMIYSDEALAQRDTNIIKEAIDKERPIIFKEGKDSGLEIYGKAVAKKFNLDHTIVNVKDPDKITEAIHKTAATGDVGLQEQIKLLQADNDKHIRNLEIANQTQEALKFDSTLLFNLPTKKNNKLMSNEEFIAITKKNLKFENDNGVMIVKNGDKVYRDEKTQAPLPLNAALELYYKDRGWLEQEQQLQPSGGRGAGDKLAPGGAGIRKASEHETQWKIENPDKLYSSPEAVASLRSAAAAAGPGNFDYNS
jgi:hypothetical protein